jgi:hypothetical protein
MREAIEGAVGEDGVVEERDPFIHGAVAGHNRGTATVPFDEDVVDIAGLLGGELSEAEVVQDEEVLVTAYRPDPARWTEDFLRRRP